MRGVKKLAPEARAHAVSAYYPAIRAALDQVFIAEKDNAITAIPELLALLDLKGRTVTIDAIGTQVEIVQYLRAQQAD